MDKSLKVGEDEWRERERGGNEIRAEAGVKGQILKLQKWNMYVRCLWLKISSNLNNHKEIVMSWNGKKESGQWSKIYIREVGNLKYMKIW